MEAKSLTRFEIKNRRLRHIISFPFIMVLIVPLMFFDFLLEIYHHICFPLYRLPLVERWKYLKMDRHHLSYLNPLEKVFCAYCGYGNGLLRYGAAIAAETEGYWCAIKHQKSKDFIEPPHHKKFAEYGDEEGYRELLKRVRPK